MKRVIFHIDLDAFFASVEQLRHPRLRGRPVVVGGDPDRRGVVASASYEARRYGIRSAMPLARAKKLCPHCVFAPCRFNDYEKVSARLFHLLGRFTPDVEPLSLEEAYLDMSRFRWLYSHPLQTAERIHCEIKRDLGLVCSLGVASNKLVARIASARAKPGGILYVLPGHERVFLSRLPVRHIPGVGPRTAGELTLLGVKTIGDLAVVGEKLLIAALGEYGSRLYEASRGKDNDPVIPPSEPKSVSREVTFPEDLLIREKVLADLSLLTERCCRALREAGKQAKTVTVKLRYADFKTVTRSRTFAEPTDLDAEVFEIAKALLRKAWTRRLKIRLIGVRLSALTGSGWQTQIIGGERRSKLKRLYVSLDRIKKRYGFASIINATSLLAVKRYKDTKKRFLV